MSYTVSGLDVFSLVTMTVTRTSQVLLRVQTPAVPVNRGCRAAQVQQHQQDREDHIPKAHIHQANHHGVGPGTLAEMHQANDRLGFDR